MQQYPGQRWGEEGGSYTEITFAYAQLTREDEDSDVEQGAPPPHPRQRSWGSMEIRGNNAIRIYVEFHGNPWTWAIVHTDYYWWFLIIADLIILLILPEYSWLFLIIAENCWILGGGRKQMSLRVFLSIADYFWFLLIIADYYWFFLIIGDITDYCWLLLIITDYSWLLSLITDYSWFLLIITDYS